MIQNLFVYDETYQKFRKLGYEVITVGSIPSFGLRVVGDIGSIFECESMETYPKVKIYAPNGDFLIPEWVI